jgi:alkanesulfonate monooxygenase SsuD/methylene tetrahydromethanopterin reductase-like flavin-dependent oxidoreductase (luciferase family)
LHIGHLASTHEKAWDEIEPHLQWHMKIHFRALAAAENMNLRMGSDLTIPPLGELRNSGRGPYGPVYVGTPDEVIRMLDRN